METRRMIVALFASLAVFYLWLWISPFIFGPPDQASETTPTPVDDGGAATPQADGRADRGTATQTSAAPGSRPAGDDAKPAPAELVSARGLQVTEGSRESPVLLGSAADDSPYPMEIEILPRGAVVSRVKTRGHYDTVDEKIPYPIIEPLELPEATGDARFAYSFAATKVRFENRKLNVPLDDRVWSVSSISDKHVEFSVDVLYDGQPLARIFKTYTLEPQPPEERTYDLSLALRIENRSPEALEVTVTQQGPIGFRREQLRGEDRNIVAALWEDGAVESEGYERKKVFKQTKIKLGSDNEEGRTIAWVAEGNRYFTCIMTPAGRDGPEAKLPFAQVDAIHLTEVENDSDRERQDLTFQYITNSMGIPAGGFSIPLDLEGDLSKDAVSEELRAEFAKHEVELSGKAAIQAEEPGRRWLISDDGRRYPITKEENGLYAHDADRNVEVAFDCYIGPKSKPAFQEVEAYRKRDYYAVISESFLCCAPGPLVGMMMWLLNACHAIPPYNYGIAIIVLVLVVRAALHPITKKSQVNMMKMQKQTAKLQPKIQAVKEKYANDRGKMNQAVMEIYREEGINPAGNLLSCLPMLLQIPIWGALWTALAHTIEMRHAPFDGWWIKDLTRPDALIPFGQAIKIPLIHYIMNGPIEAFNLLPILLGLSQILQARFMPRGSPSTQSGGNPDQLEQQRKMMMFMSIFFIFVLYNAPSGLTLYIMARPKSQGPGKPGEPRSKSWLQKKFESLQKHAEEAKRIESPRKKSKARK